MNRIIGLGLVTVLATAWSLAQQNASEEPKTITGTYQIYQGEKLIATDRFEVIHGKKTVDKITLTGGKEERTIEIGYTGKVMSSYQQIRNGLPELRGGVENGLLSFYDEKEAMVSAVPVEGELLMVEPSAYGELALLLHRYSKAGGGKQSFEVVLPSLQDFVKVEVERHGSDVFTVRGSNSELPHYRMAFGRREVVNCWTDNGRIVGMYFATKGTIVAEASYDQLRDQIKKVINRAM